MRPRRCDQHLWFSVTVLNFDQVIILVPDLSVIHILFSSCFHLRFVLKLTKRTLVRNFYVSKNHRQFLDNSIRLSLKLSRGLFSDQLLSKKIITFDQYQATTIRVLVKYKKKVLFWICVVSHTKNSEEYIRVEQNYYKQTIKKMY